MDRTYSQGVLQKVAVDSASHSSRRVAAAIANDEPTTRYAYHSRYVHDLGLLFQEITKPRDKIKRLRERISEDPYLSDPAEMRKGFKTAYVVPSISSNRNPIGFPLLQFARQRVLEAVDALIYMEGRDNELLRTKTAS